MEQIKAHIAVSLDGHTATPDYELDWMPREVKELAAREHAAASCLLMGANTYNYIFEHWGGWPHKSKRSFVVSHYDTNVTPDCGVEFLTEEPLQRVYELKQETDMLVVGGGKLLTSLIKAGLLDSLTIYTVPVMAGKGIGFVGETSGSLWKLSESRVLDNGAPAPLAAPNDKRNRRTMPRPPPTAPPCHKYLRKSAHRPAVLRQCSQRSAAEYTPDPPA